MCSPRRRRPLAPQPPNLSNTPQFPPGTCDTETVDHPTQLNMPLDHRTAMCREVMGRETMPVTWRIYVWQI